MLKRIYVAMNVMALFLAVQPALAEYRMTELTGLGGPSEATSINDLGQAVGSSSVYDFACPWAVLWTPDGTPVYLGTTNSKGLASTATGINNHGIIIGTRNMRPDTCDRGIFHAFIIVPEDNIGKDGIPDTWFRDKDGNGINDLMVDLFSRDSRVSSFVTGINDAGQAAGYTQDEYGRTIGFVINPIDQDVDGKPDTWFLADKYGNNTLMTRLEVYYSSIPYAINNKGEVVGSLSDEKGPAYGVVWAADSGRLIRKSHVVGRAISDNGTIAGSYMDIAYLDLRGSLLEIGTLGGASSSAMAINIAEQAVGRSLDASGNINAWRAFLWQDGQLSDLGALPGGTSEANSINRAGQIVGRSTDAEQKYRAVIWNYVETPAEQVESIAEDLTTLVQDGSISQGDGAALTATLNTAADKLNQGNTTAACNTLNAFVNQTNAKIRSGKLSAEQGRALIDSAGSVSACK